VPCQYRLLRCTRPSASPTPLFLATDQSLCCAVPPFCNAVEQKLGFDLQQGAIDYMVEYIDKDGNGQIDFQEFCEFVDMVVKGQLPTDEEIAQQALRANVKHLDWKKRKQAQKRSVF